MRDTLVYLLLFGGVDSDRPWGKEEQGQVRLPGPRLRPPLHAARESLGIEMITVPMHDDGPDAEAVAALVADDPVDQGHVGRADLRQPGRRHLQPGGRRAARRRCRPPPTTSRSSGTTPTRCTTSPRRRPRAPTSSPWPRRPATRTARSCSRRPRRSPSPEPASRSSPPRTANVAWYLGHLGNGSIGPDKVNHLRHVAVLRLAAGRARPHGQAPRDHRAQVRRGRPGAHRAARRSRGRDLEQARPAATSSTSTSCPARPAAWSPSPRRPASR